MQDEEYEQNLRSYYRPLIYEHKITKNIKIKENKCMINPEWLYDIKKVKFIPINDKYSSLFYNLHCARLNEFQVTELKNSKNLKLKNLKKLKNFAIYSDKN